MRDWKKAIKRAISVAAACTMLAAPCIQPLGGQTVRAAGSADPDVLDVPNVPIEGMYTEERAAEEVQTYENEINALPKEAYKEFGLTAGSPEEFDPDDPEHPLENYGSTYFSELCIGQFTPADNSVRLSVADNITSEPSASSFDLDHMLQDRIGSEIQNSFDASGDHQCEIRGSDTCAADLDGDGVDEILTSTLVYHPDHKIHDSAASEMYVGSYDYDEQTGRWKYINGGIQWTLSFEDDGDPEFAEKVSADTLKAYMTMAAGDFNGDGREEVAVYYPVQRFKKRLGIQYNGPIIQTLGCPGEGAALTVLNTFSLSELEGGQNVFCHEYDGQIMPVVDLSTTRISGQDDLVVNVSQPMTSKNGQDKSYGQGSAMGIYHFEGIAPSDKIICRYINKDVQYGSMRMRFASALDADVDGDGVEELVVGGYKNTGIGGICDVGTLDPSKNLLQLFRWNESSRRYEEACSTPKEVEARSSLIQTDAQMMEPAAMAAGRLYTNDRMDRIFLEGNIFGFHGERGHLSEGSFVKEHSISLGGGSRSFISAAYAGSFSMGGMDTEQIVLLCGSFSGNSDKATMDVLWIWQDDRGKLNDAITNADHPGGTGRYPTLCPLNVDDDKTTDVRYKGKEYGWSAPTLYSVLQSPPYWSELQYNSETYGAGEVSYAVTCGRKSGTEGEWGLGLGLYFEASAMLGPKILGEKVTVGGGFEVGLMGRYVGSYGSAHAVKDSVEFIVAPGEDQAIVLAVPLVIYHYEIRIPAYVATQEDIDNYNELRKVDPDLPAFGYKVGDTVPESWETYDVQAALDPAFSNLPVEEYNELVEKYGDETGLKPVTEETFAEKTIGDPSTYPHSDAELKKPGNVQNLHLSKNAVRTTVGESGKKIGYEFESEKEYKNGFELEFDGALFLKAEAEETIPFVVTAEEEVEGGVKLAADGGCSWISSSSDGMEFSTTICDLPQGSEDYGFTTRLAVFNNADLPMGKGSNDGAYCIGYVVTGVDGESAPPKLPVDLRVFATTEKAAVLKWDLPGYRQARSYEIYTEDNNGHPQSIGSTTGDRYVATELVPATQYRYAVKAYQNADCTGNASVLSRWVTAVTKDSSDSAPRFVEQPSYVVASVDDGQSYALTAKAEKGVGMEDASLTYQWQKCTAKSLTGEVVWEDLDGALTDADGTSRYPLPQVTAENAADLDQTHYRVVVAQTRNGNVKSIISKIATLYVNRGGEGQRYCTLDMDLGMAGQDNVYEQDGVYYMERGTAAACTVSLSSPMDSVDVLPGSQVVFWYKKDGADGISEGRLGNGIIAGDGTATVTLNSKDAEDLPGGVYELYAIYPGETVQAVTYLPARADPITLHVVEVYRIGYHLNGGINSPENPTILTNESAPAGLRAPIRNYYEFGGWYQDEGLTVPFEGDTLDPSALTGDVNLYAKWIPISYAVAYELDGGENPADNPLSYTVEDTLILKDPTRPGYHFEGWYLDAGFTDGPVEQIARATGADMTLYAKWSPQAYQIVYELNGGTNNGKNPSSYTIKDTITLKDPAYPGHIFAGWYLDVGYTDGPVTEITGDMCRDLTLYAKWEGGSPLDQDEKGAYLIADYDDLAMMARMIQSGPQEYASADYVQTNNINCTEQEWALTIGTEDVPFAGTYEGNDYYILSLHQSRGKIGGLFGVIAERGVVRNLSVIDLDCAGQADTVGGLAGINRGMIIGCGSGVNLHSEATIFRDGELVTLSSLNSQVNGIDYAGGLVGCNQGIIQDSRSNAAVSGKTAGGIAGKNTGTIRNVYNTGTVKGQERAGGMAGENAGAGSIRYGYNNQPLTDGKTRGGIVGYSENTNIEHLWYHADTEAACGNQDESALIVGKKKAEEIASQEFCDTLNEAAAGEKDKYGFRDWTWSESKNSGYPMLSYAVVEQQTLTHAKTGIQVSGQIHPGAQLKLVDLTGKHEDLQVIKRSLRSGSYVKGWRLALQYADGSYATWEGKLSVGITSDLIDDIKKLRIVQVDEDGSYSEPRTARAGKKLTIQTDSLGSFSLVRTGPKATQKLKTRYTSLKKSVGASKVTQTVRGAKTKTTFTSSDPKVVTVDKKGRIRFLGVGTANITVRAAEDENYQPASKRCRVTVVPKTPKIRSLVSGEKGCVTIKSNKAAKGNTGYTIQYKIKGEKKTHKIRVKAEDARSKTIRGLPSGKKISVRIRAYKIAKEKTYHGSYGKYKTVVVR